MVTKYTTLTLWLVAAAMTTTLAQIPNRGFEDWIDHGTYLNPMGWWTPNDSVKSGSFYPVTRSEDHYPATIGNYSMRLENNPALYPDWASVGVTWTGDFSGNDNPAFSSMGHPNSLWGYYKFFPQNGDTMEIHIRLYQGGEDVAGGSFKTAETAAEWTPFSLTLSEYDDADSARIFLSSCYDNDEPVPHGNSVLYIDNLSFNALITGLTADAGKDPTMIRVYPNPTRGPATLSVTGPAGQRVDLSIFDALGRRVLSNIAANCPGTIPLDLSALPAGPYLLHATIDRQSICTMKILIMH